MFEDKSIPVGENSLEKPHRGWFGVMSALSISLFLQGQPDAFAHEKKHILEMEPISYSEYQDTMHRAVFEEKHEQGDLLLNEGDTWYKISGFGFSTENRLITFQRVDWLEQLGEQIKKTGGFLSQEHTHPKQGTVALSPPSIEDYMHVGKIGTYTPTVQGVVYDRCGYWTIHPKPDNLFTIFHNEYATRIASTIRVQKQDERDQGLRDITKELSDRYDKDILATVEQYLITAQNLLKDETLVNNASRLQSQADAVGKILAPFGVETTYKITNISCD